MGRLLVRQRKVRWVDSEEKDTRTLIEVVGQDMGRVVVYVYLKKIWGVLTERVVWAIA